jgi:hypothetical protein
VAIFTFLPTIIIVVIFLKDANSQTNEAKQEKAHNNG